MFAMTGNPTDLNDFHCMAPDETKPSGWLFNTGWLLKP